jgi:hypothetical protein
LRDFSVALRVHAPPFYEFASQIRLNACCRTKHIADSRNYDLQEEKTDRFAVCLFVRLEGN